MSEDVRATIQRAGSPVASDVFVQLDKMSSSEAAYYGGSASYFIYNALTTGLPITDPELIRQSDLLLELSSTLDPTTSQSRQWRIKNDPEPFPDGHWEWVCDLYRGT